MPINSFQISPTSAHRMIGRTMYIPYPPYSSNTGYILALTTASSAMTVGTALTLLETITRGVHSLAFTPGASVVSNFVFTVIGEDQFGATVTETVTVTTASTIVHTVYTYRKITSITPTAKSSTGTDTVGIGWTGVVTSGTPRLPLPCKPSSLTSIKYISMLGQGALPTFTPELANYTIAISANPLLINTTGGMLIVTFDDNDPAL